MISNIKKYYIKSFFKIIKIYNGKKGIDNIKKS